MGASTVNKWCASMTKAPHGIVLILAAFHAQAQDTTITVPQGSGVFPTIGQVDCEEESGSGRFCAATYECSEGSGELWDDMANHNGRRPISSQSPVARQRDCVITVDGKAAVRWFVGYAPGGREGDVVGVTTSAGALRPVQRIERVGGGGGNLLDYMLERYDVTMPEHIEEECGHIRVGHRDRERCEVRVQRSAAGLRHLLVTPYSECAVEFSEAHQGCPEDCTLDEVMLHLNELVGQPHKGDLLFSGGRRATNWGGVTPDLARECKAKLASDLEDYGIVPDEFD